MITREENHDVLLLRDRRHDHHVAVKVTDDRLWALTRWVSGKLEIFKNTSDEKEIYIFFKSADVRSYVRPGEWIVKSSNGIYLSATDGHIQNWNEDPANDSQPYHAQLWYQT